MVCLNNFRAVIGVPWVESGWELCFRIWLLTCGVVLNARWGCDSNLLFVICRHVWSVNVASVSVSSDCSAYCPRNCKYSYIGLSCCPMRLWNFYGCSLNGFIQVRMFCATYIVFGLYMPRSKTAPNFFCKIKNSSCCFRLCSSKQELYKGGWVALLIY
jgi:hypothetical protein